MPEYTAKHLDHPLVLGKTTDYSTVQYDLWDMVSIRCYGDERTMSQIIEANWDVRNRLGWVVHDDEFFPADVVLKIPKKVDIIYDLRPNVIVPDISQLLPWR